MEGPMFERVAILGGGIAGLVAARVLADHALEVVLVERDRISEHPAGPRKGVPQAWHAHSLLAGGHRALELLFPGLRSTLQAAGATTGRGAFHCAGGYLEAGEANSSLFASRGLLEATLRRRVLALPNLRLRDGWQVDSPPRLRDGRLAAVELSRLAGDENKVMDIDLLVDASGRASRMSAWLSALGFDPPPIERIPVRMRYATRHVQRRPGDLDGRSFFSVTPTPNLPRACAVLAQEGDRWIVTLVGYFGEQPPDDDKGFLDFARSLPAGDVAQLLESAEPSGGIRTFSFPASVRVRYERARRLPQGLMVAGDALACLTPVYGQGMTIAALQGQALQQCLLAGRDGLDARFRAAAARVVDMAWTITAGNDRALFPGASFTLAQRLRYRWVQRVIAAGHRDARVAEDFLCVTRLLRSPASLLRPTMVARVIGTTARLRATRGPGAQPPAGSAASVGATGSSR